MKNLSNLGFKALSRVALKSIVGGIEEDGGTATCTFKCAGPFTITCEGNNCRGEDSSPDVLGWCEADGTPRKTCYLQ